MTEHPITPPPELLSRWKEDWHHAKVKHIELEDHIAAQAARWGADQELEACCEWLYDTCVEDPEDIVPELRATRRPKQPSLKEQALGALYAIATGADDTREFYQDLETIKQALESLPND
jgi:hypothetical protein